MSTIVNNAIAIVIASLIGIAIGIWMKQRGTAVLRSSSDDPPSPDDPSRHRVLDTSDRSQVPEPVIKTDLILSCLRNMAEQVAADVSAHTAIVEDVGRQIESQTLDAGPEVKQLLQQLSAANGSICQRLWATTLNLTRQKRQIEEQVADARIDAVTGLPNGRVFDDDIQKCLSQAIAEERPSSLMFLDIDFFKNINDRFGFHAGDEVLRKISTILCKDLSDRETVYRYGGEKFGVIFFGSGLAAARPAAERARDAIGDVRVELDGQELWVTVSAGLASVRDGDAARDLIHRADMALHASKEAGRDCGHWNDAMDCVPFLDDRPPATDATEPAAKACPTSDEVVVTRVPVEASTVGESEPTSRPSEQEHESRAANSQTETPEDLIGKEDLRVQAANIIAFSDRQAWQGDVTRRLASWRRGGDPLALMFVRLDEHGWIEEEHGTEVVLRSMSVITSVLMGLLREMDHVAKFRESMIGVLLPDIDQDSVILVAERVRRGIEELRIDANGTALTISVSIGLIESMKGHESAEIMISQAEAALDVAAGRGGNRTFVHNGKRVEQVFVLDTGTSLMDVDDKYPQVATQ